MSKKVENDERVEQDKVGRQEKKKRGEAKRRTGLQGKRDSAAQDGRRQECQCVGLLPRRQRCLEPASLSTTINNSPGYVGCLFFVAHRAASLSHSRGTVVFFDHPVNTVAPLCPWTG